MTANTDRQEPKDPIRDALMAALGYVKGETYGYLAHEDQPGPDEIIAELEAALATPPPCGGEADLLRDALRWRAVVCSARVRCLGSAGLHSETDPYGNPHNGYAHIGLELWTKHEAGTEPSAVRDFTTYADKAVAVMFPDAALASTPAQVVVAQEPVAWMARWYEAHPYGSTYANEAMSEIFDVKPEKWTGELVPLYAAPAGQAVTDGRLRAALVQLALECEGIEGLGSGVIAKRIRAILASTAALTPPAGEGGNDHG